MIDGQPCRKPYGLYRSFGRWYDEFYIHPQTGLLCVAVQLPKKLPQQRDDFVIIDADHHYLKVDEIWYLIALQDLPAFGYVWDVVLRELVQREYGRAIHAASKRQCNKREIKQIMHRLCLHSSVDKSITLLK